MDQKLFYKYRGWVKVTASVVAQLFLFSSISLTFASPISSRSHLRTPPVSATDGGTRFLLEALRGEPLQEARALASQLDGADLDQRISQLIGILEAHGGLKADPKQWLPILTYALSPESQAPSLFTEVQKSQSELFAQCRSCGVSLLHQAPKTARKTQILQPSHDLDLVGALATAIDAVHQGGLIRTHGVTNEVMHSAYALSRLMGGYVARFEVVDEEALRTLKELLSTDKSFVMAHVRDQDPNGDHFVQIEKVETHQMTLVDRGKRRTTNTAHFLKIWTGVVITPNPTLKHLNLSDAEAQKIFGCCGIAAASGIKQHSVIGVREKRPVAVSFLPKLASISKRVINVLQSRGFDNYADARKYFMWVTDVYSGIPPEALTAMQQDPSMVFLDVEGDRSTGKQHRILKFMVTSRGVGSSVANSDTITSDIEEQILKIGRKVFGETDLFVANDVLTSDYLLYRSIWRPEKNSKLYTLPEAVAWAKTAPRGKGIRFSAKSREAIEEIFSREKAEYQDFSAFKTETPGVWELYANPLALRRVYLEGVNKHTRYKTKGTDRSVNAHHWVYKGYTLGHNGDFESFQVFRTILKEVFGETFEGETDSEVLLHVIGDLGERSEGGVTTYAPSEIAIQRAFRLIERVETLLSLRKILGVEGFKGPFQESIRGELMRLGMDEEGIRKISEDASLGPKGEISKAVEEWIISSLRNPESLDGAYQNYYKHFISFFADAKSARRIVERGVSNIAINALSLHDAHQIVVARMYEDNNKFFLLLSQDGDIVVQASEARGAAPEVGVMTETPRDAIPGVLAIARGWIKQIESPPWSILTVDGTRILYHDILTGHSEDGRDLVKKTDIKWNVIRDQKTYDAQTDFERETMLQPTTVAWTFDAFTRWMDEVYQLKTEGLNLQERDFRGAPSIIGIGSGSSFNALKQVQAEMGYFDILETSNDIQSDFPRSIQKGSIVVIVSQSGETGAAQTAAKLALERGAKVVVITNRRGSSLYNVGMDSGGVMVTESVDEQAVAATGSNSSQVQALRFFGLRRRELLDEITPEQINTTLAALSLLGKQHIPAVLEEFQEGGDGARAIIENIFPYLEKHGVQGSFVGNQFILTGMGGVQKATGDEVGLKITEVARHPMISVDMDTLLAYSGEREGHRWDGSGVDDVITHNLHFYTKGDLREVGKKARFTLSQGFRLTEAEIKDAPQIVLLSNGRYDALAGYLYAKYRGKSSVPIVLQKYSSGTQNIKNDALVVALEPQDTEALQTLSRLQERGIKPVVIATQATFVLPGLDFALARGGSLVAHGKETDAEFAYGVIADLLFAHLLGMRGDVEDQFIQDTVQALTRIKVTDILSSFRKPGSPLHNQENLDRLIQILRNRRWQSNFWSTGKASFLSAAIDFALRIFASTGRLAGWGETSEFKHGPYSATNFGDVFMTQYPGRASPEYGDVKKTAIDEVIPRVNYPYAFLAKEFEPGTVVFIGAEDPGDDYLRFLNDEEFQDLRNLRKDVERQKEQYDLGLRPDIVFLTPTGHFIERLAVNRLVSQALAEAKAIDLPQDQRGNVFFVVEGDPNNPQYAETEQRFEAKKSALRESFPGALFVSIAPKSNESARETSDVVLHTETGDFTEALVIGHRLASLLVRKRVGETVERLLTLYQEVEHHPAFSNSPYKTPGELLKAYAELEPEAIRIMEQIAPDQEAFKGEILKAFELENLDFFSAIASARLPQELWHSQIDLIQKLAKVVTNRDGGNKQALLPPLHLPGIGEYLHVNVYRSVEEMPVEMREAMWPNWRGHGAFYEIKNDRLGYIAYVGIHKDLPHSPALRLRLTHGYWESHRDDAPWERFVWTWNKLLYGQWTVGETRVQQFATDTDAVVEVAGLSEAMSRKSILSRLPFGGGKVTVRTDFDPTTDLERKWEIQRDVAKVLEKLQVILTAVDMNTDDVSVLKMAEAAPYVMLGTNDPAIAYGGAIPHFATAKGIILGMRVGVEFAFPDAPTLEGKSVAVQGVGDVGSEVLAYLLDDELVGKVYITDPDPKRIEAARERHAEDVRTGRLVILEDLDSIYDLDVDIFSPTAVKHALNSKTIPRLKVKMVAGAANVQLENPEAGVLLHERGILYVPDYVINSGGLGATETHLVGFDIDDNVLEIEPAVRNVLEYAKAHNLPPSEAADILADEAIEKLQSQIVRGTTPEAVAEMELLQRTQGNPSEEEIAALMTDNPDHWIKSELPRRTRLMEEWKLSGPTLFGEAFEAYQALHQKYVNAASHFSRYAEDGGVKGPVDRAVDRITARLKNDPEVGEEGVRERIDMVKPESILKKIAVQTRETSLQDLAAVLTRDFLLATQKGLALEALPMPSERDLYLPMIDGMVDYLSSVVGDSKVIVVSSSWLLDEHLGTEALSQLLASTSGGQGNLFFTEPSETVAGKLAIRYGKFMPKLQKRFVSGNLKPLGPLASVVLLLDASDQGALGVQENQLLSLTQVGEVRNAFVVPLMIEEPDLLKAVYLGLNLVSQFTSLKEKRLDSLDAATKLLLAEVANGFPKAEALVGSIQTELEQAEHIVSTLVKGL